MNLQKVMLWGWFGFENLGDDLLLSTMTSNLLADFRSVIVPMRSMYNINSKNVTQINRSYKELFKGAIENDVLIIGPGGLFPFDRSGKVIAYFLITLLWKIFGKKVVFFGIGISDRMSSISGIFWKSIVFMSDLFITRSPFFIKKLGIKESARIYTMADTVFSSKLVFREFSTENRIAIFVANLKQDGMEKQYRSVVKTWQDIISALLDRELSVDLFAFTKGTDDKLISDIACGFSKDKVRTIYYEDVPSSICELKKYKMTISMRFHALVLSLLAEVPTIPIAYGQKTHLLAEESGLSEYLIIWNNFQKEYYGHIKDIKADELLKKIDLLLSQYDEVKERMHCSAERFRASAENAMSQLLVLINQK